MHKKGFLLIFGVLAFFLALWGCQARSENFDQKLKRADFCAQKGIGHIEKAIGMYESLRAQSLSRDQRNALQLKLGNLYMRTGRYDKAIDSFKVLDGIEARKLLAAAYFKNAQYADALALFELIGQLPDDEYLYYFAQAAEKVNLYDKAVALYAAIQAQSLRYDKAQERLEAINLSEDVLDGGQIKTLLERTPRQEDYPEAGAVILLADEEFEVFEDNTSEYRFHSKVKIFNDRGKKSFSEITIGYDSTYEEVELEYARTIRPDGSVVYVGDKNIRDVSLYLNYPLYSNARVRIISMPEVADGVIIEYKAKKIRKQMVNKKDFIANYGVQEGEPIHEALFTVMLPEKRAMQYRVINEAYNTFDAQLSPQKTQTSDKKLYRWHFKGIPEIIPEPAMSPVSRVNPIIMMSSFSQWQDVYEWWHPLYQDKTAIDEAIRNKIQELTASANTFPEKVRALYNFCAQDIRYVAVEYGQAGYEPHQAADIFKNKYGDCKDQAILLVGMLRSIGASAYPVLISTYDRINLQPEFPSIAFNHCIAVVEIEGEWIFMDPTGETVSFGDLPAMDQDRDVFVILDNQYRIMRTPLFDAEHNASKKNTDLIINDDETITVTRRILVNGMHAQGQRQWLRSTKPELIEEVLRASAHALAPGAELKEYDIKNQDDLNKDVEITYSFDAPEFLTRAGSFRLLPQLGSFDVSAVAKQQRRYPIEYPILKESIVTTRIHYPANLRLQYLPEDLEFDCEWFRFENRYVSEGNTISFYSDFHAKKNNIPQSDYGVYKALLEGISRKVNQRIILEENN